MEKTKTFNHAEAFCLMEYDCKTCPKREMLWNSRDGVTPFVIECNVCGGEAVHIDWGKDFRSLNHKPEVGERFFVDLTKEKHREYQMKKIERYWNHEKTPMSERFKSKHEALHSLCEGFEGGRPDIKTMGSGPIETDKEKFTMEMGLESAIEKTNDYLKSPIGLPLGNCRILENQIVIMKGLKKLIETIGTFDLPEGLK